MLLNRHQNHQRIVYFNPENQSFQLIFEYKHEQYVDEPTIRRSLEQDRNALDVQQEEMLRVASLLQEFGNMGSSRPFFEKAITCLVRAVGAQHGFLLSRNGTKLRVLAAIDGEGKPIQKAGALICVDILEKLFEDGEPVLAPQVIEHDRIATFEALYKNNITSLAVLPLRAEGEIRGALYLNNPDPLSIPAPMGSPVVQAYQNLVSLILPRIAVPG